MVSLSLEDTSIFEELECGILVSLLWCSQVLSLTSPGGMPSPARDIPVTVVASDWFVPVQSEEGTAYLPPSIKEGSSITIEGSIKVLIRERTDAEMPPNNTQFKRTDTLLINATMPWLNRIIPNFEFAKEVPIEYPCELRNFHNLSTVALGSRNKIKFEVYNKGHMSIGPNSRLPRSIEIEVTCPPDYGSLESQEGEWLETVSKPLRTILADDAISVAQNLAIRDDAEPYQHIVAIVNLWLGTPSQNAAGDQEEVVLVQRYEVPMQVSDHFMYNPLAEFLLVTNSITNRLRTQKVKRFIQEDLRMEVDVWNAALYGGLQQHDPETDQSQSILEKYHGKTVVFFGNAFEFFGRGGRNIIDICDPRALAVALSNGTNCVFLDAVPTTSYTNLVRRSGFCSQETLPYVHDNLVESKKFSNIDEMLRAVRQQKLHGSLGFAKYSVTARTRELVFIEQTQKRRRRGLQSI